MAANPGTIIIAEINSPDGLDTYPTHLAERGKGGHRSVADTTARDAIEALRREEGMIVYVQDIDTFYYLKNGITNLDWVELPSSPSVDVKVKITATDTTEDYLNEKVTASTGISLAVINPAGDEQLQITNSDTGSGAVSTHESSYDHSKIHDRKHNIDGTDDHTGISGDENNFMAINANGLPKDSGVDSTDFISSTDSGKVKVVLGDTLEYLENKFTVSGGLFITNVDEGGGYFHINIDNTITQYTDELAQDAIGSMIVDTNTIDITYTDATPELKADVRYEDSTSINLSDSAAGLKAEIKDAYLTGLGDARYLMLDLSNDPISGTLQHHGNYLIGLTTVTGDSTDTIASAYDGVLTTGGTDIGTGTQQTVDFLFYGHDYRIRQDGDIVSVSFYLNTITDVTGITLKVWRKTGTLYNFIGSASISGYAQGTNTDLSASITGVREGDFIGMLIEKSDSTDNDEFKARTEPSHENVYYFNSTKVTPGVDWEGGADGDFGGSLCVPVVVKMSEAPYIVFIGDSIMEGQTGTTPFSGNMSFCNDDADITDINNAIPYFVGKSLGVSYQNMAIGGQLMHSDIVNRFTADVVNLKPKIVVINGGVNDIIFGGGSGEEVAADYETILDACDANGIIPVVMSICPASGSTTEQAQAVDSYNALIKAQVDGHTSAIWIETKDYVGQDRTVLGDLWDQQEIYNSDDLHFTSLGYRRLSEAIIDGISQIKVYGKLHASNIRVEHGITFDGDNTKYIGIERQDLYDTYGNPLVIHSGGASLGSTNKVGGDLILQSGISTGTAKSKIVMYVPSAGSSGSDDNVPAALYTMSEKGWLMGGNTFASWVFDVRKTDENILRVGSTATASCSTVARILDGGTFLMDDIDYESGTGFIARDTATSHIVLGEGALAVYTKDSLTPGNTFTSNLRIKIDGTYGVLRINQEDYSAIQISQDEVASSGHKMIFAITSSPESGIIGTGFDVINATTLAARDTEAAAIAFSVGETIFYGNTSIGTPTFTGTERLRIHDDGTLQINRAYILPNSDGNDGQVLTTDGSGNVAWEDSGGGSTSPGGDSTNIQFNNSGSFDGDAELAWDTTDKTLTIINIAKSGIRVAVGVDGTGGCLSYSGTTDAFIVGDGFDQTTATELTARDTEASAIAFQDGLTIFYGDTSLTSGNTFTATERLKIYADGKFEINNAYILPNADGATGQILSTNGSGTLSWKDTSSLHCAKVYLSSDQTLGAASATVIGFNSEVFDTGSDYNTSTYKWLPDVAGYYRVFAHLVFNAVANAKYVNTYIQKNGSGYEAIGYKNAGIAGALSCIAETIVYLNGSTDYVQILGRTEESKDVDAAASTSMALFELIT